MSIVATNPFSFNALTALTGPNSRSQATYGEAKRRTHKFGKWERRLTSIVLIIFIVLEIIILYWFKTKSNLHFIRILF